jgi:hypothetical protein
MGEIGRHNNSSPLSRILTPTLWGKERFSGEALFLDLRSSRGQGIGEGVTGVGVIQNHNHRQIADRGELKMKTIGFVASTFFLGVMIALTIGAAQHSLVQNDSLGASTASTLQAAAQVTPTVGHNFILTLQATAPGDLSGPPSVLDGAPALPSPPR